jgi:hypothetical protein
MPGTWDQALPTPRDRARLALGDTGFLTSGNGQSIWLLEDETLDSLLAQGYELGVAEAAESLVARFAQLPDKLDESEGARQEWSHRIAAWKDLASRMRAARPTQTPAATVGGVTAVGRIKDPAGLGDLR